MKKMWHTILKRVHENKNCFKNTVNHIMIQVDGDRRWAKKNKKSYECAYIMGFKSLINIAIYCCKIGINNLTVQMFSSETFKRKKSGCFCRKTYSL